MKKGVTIMYIEDLTNPIPQQSLKYGNKMIGLILKTPEDLEKDKITKKEYFNPFKGLLK